jgi:hypothetical protein
MTRIKKRRSGKKRTKDRKKVSAGRRGARAIKKEIIAKQKKENPVQPATPETEPGKTQSSAKKTTGKTRSAGARRIAVAKSVAADGRGAKAGKKIPVAKKEGSSEEKPVKKGFAPWNKNKFRKKDK